MEIILIMLTSTILGAFLLLSFYLGFRYGKACEKEKEITKELTIDETNIGAMRDIQNWVGYGGKR